MPWTGWKSLGVETRRRHSKCWHQEIARKIAPLAILRLMLSAPLAKRDVKSLRAASRRGVTPFHSVAARRASERVISVGKGLYRWRVLDACELEKPVERKGKTRTRSTVCACTWACITGATNICTNDKGRKKVESSVGRDEPIKRQDFSNRRTRDICHREMTGHPMSFSPACRTPDSRIN